MLSCILPRGRQLIHYISSCNIILFVLFCGTFGSAFVYYNKINGNVGRPSGIGNQTLNNTKELRCPKRPSEKCAPSVYCLQKIVLKAPSTNNPP